MTAAAELEREARERKNLRKAIDDWKDYNQHIPVEPEKPCRLPCTDLARLVELTKKVSSPETQSSYPARINGAALRALFDNLDEVTVSAAQESSSGYGPDDVMNAREARALAVDAAIRLVRKADWRGNRIKEREVHNAIKSELDDEGLVNTIFEIVKAQSDY